VLFLYEFLLTNPFYNPAMSVSVERIFSRGRILLQHLQNRLSTQSVCALLCVGDWLKEGILTKEDIQKILDQTPEVVSDEECELPEDWAKISR
jgi:hypothetical protein